MASMVEPSAAWRSTLRASAASLITSTPDTVRALTTTLAAANTDILLARSAKAASSDAPHAPIVPLVPQYSPMACDRRKRYGGGRAGAPAFELTHSSVFRFLFCAQDRG